MPTRHLPNDPSVENLKKQAKSLHKLVRAGDAEALARVKEFHPRGDAALAGFTLSDAQLALAREFGFTSWPRLAEYLKAVEQYAWAPPEGETEDPADAMVRLACLTYGGDLASRHEKARTIFAQHPDIAGRDISAAATVGDVAAVRRMLMDEPGLARQRVGPNGWEPLLYVCYSRLNSTSPEHSTLEVARLLLKHGADPNAGFLWRGTYPFTALTGAFGEGEAGPTNQPPHQYSLALARLLLEAGADPNDSQSLYNRMFSRNDDHLKLLFEFGLGTDKGGPWIKRMTDRAQTPAAMLVEDLCWAAMHNHVERVKLLTEHGAEVNVPSVRDGKTPYEKAMLSGNLAIAQYLLEHGAKHVALNPAETFAAACLAGERTRAKAILTADPGLLETMGAGQAELMSRAVNNDRPDAVRLMVDLGFDVNGIIRTSALHEAAWAGNVEMLQLLVELGGDLTLRDKAYNATPLGWAKYNQQHAAAAYLKSIGATT